MYSENYPEKLDCLNYGPKITQKWLYYIQKFSKISKVNEIWNIAPGITFYIIYVFIFKNFNWPKVAWQKRINFCWALVGMFWDVIYQDISIVTRDGVPAPALLVQQPGRCQDMTIIRGTSFSGCFCKFLTLKKSNLQISGVRGRKVPWTFAGMVLGSKFWAKNRSKSIDFLQFLPEFARIRSPAPCLSLRVCAVYDSLF